MDDQIIVYLWGLVIRHIPQLKKDIEEIIGKIK